MCYNTMLHNVIVIDSPYHSYWFTSSLCCINNICKIKVGRVSLVSALCWFLLFFILPKAPLVQTCFLNYIFLVLSFQINLAKNHAYLVSTVTCSSFVQRLYVVLVKSSDILLNYLMLIQTLSQMKIKMLKNHDFLPW